MTDDILRRLLAKSGRTPESLKSTTKVGKLIRSRGVWAGPEFKRVKSLPRRRWQDDSSLVELLSARLRRPGSTATLRPMQAAWLRELETLGRVVNVANVGEGKTLCTSLASTIRRAKRPILLNFASLLHKTEREFKLLDADWYVGEYYMLSYETFSRDGYEEFLINYDPDLVVADESHALRRPSSARSRRIKRWRAARPDVPFLPLTGTPGDKAVKDSAHVADFALGEFSPFPRNHSEIELWSRALDVDVPEGRLHPGALLTLDGTDRTEGSLEEARSIFGRRVEETPGVIYKRTSSVACSLYVDALVFDGYKKSTDRLFTQARGKNSAPDGREFREGIILSTVMKWLSNGFWYVLDPAPPEAWLRARREWGAFVRDDIAHNRAGRDTPFQVAKACLRGEIERDAYDAWAAIKGTYKEQHKTVWLDLVPIEKMAQWLSDTGGIVATSFTAVGEKLAEIAGVPYFANLGIDKKTGVSIEDFAGGPCVMSIGSNRLGRNLQDRWSSMLISTHLSSSDDLEQTIGRLHRQGQKADAVEISFFVGCIESAESLYKARARAEYDRTANRNEASKLLSCDWLCPTLEEFGKKEGPRWVK